MSEKRLILSDGQREWLNQEWWNVEFCAECNCETSFTFNPIKDEFINCEECGECMHPCSSLCDSALCGYYDSCQDSIRASLLIYNGMWDEKINGKMPDNVEVMN